MISPVLKYDPLRYGSGKSVEEQLAAAEATLNHVMYRTSAYASGWIRVASDWATGAWGPGPGTPYIATLGPLPELVDGQYVSPPDQSLDPAIQPNPNYPLPKNAAYCIDLGGVALQDGYDFNLVPGSTRTSLAQQLMKVFAFLQPDFLFTIDPTLDYQINIIAKQPGTKGNELSLAVGTNLTGIIALSGPYLTGGEDAGIIEQADAITASADTFYQRMDSIFNMGSTTHQEVAQTLGVIPHTLNANDMERRLCALGVPVLNGDFIVRGGANRFGAINDLINLVGVGRTKELLHGDVWPILVSVELSNVTTKVVCGIEFKTAQRKVVGINSKPATANEFWVFHLGGVNSSNAVYRRFSDYGFAPDQITILLSDTSAAPLYTRIIPSSGVADFDKLSKSASDATIAEVAARNIGDWVYEAQPQDKMAVIGAALEMVANQNTSDELRQALGSALQSVDPKKLWPTQTLCKDRYSDYLSAALAPLQKLFNLLQVIFNKIVDLFSLVNGVILKVTNLVGAIKTMALKLLNNPAGDLLTCLIGNLDFVIPEIPIPGFGNLAIPGLPMALDLVALALRTLSEQTLVVIGNMMVALRAVSIPICLALAMIQKLNGSKIDGLECIPPFPTLSLHLPKWALELLDCYLQTLQSIQHAFDFLGVTVGSLSGFTLQFGSFSIRPPRQLGDPTNCDTSSIDNFLSTLSLPPLPV